MNPPALQRTQRRRRRCRDERGMAMVTGLVLLFAFTAGAVVWLARDVNRTVSNRAAAQSIAFQAARSGAQQIDVAVLRERGELVVDPAAARRAAEETAGLLFGDYTVDGAVVRVDLPTADSVKVEVILRDPAGDVTGIASARAEAGP